MSTARPLLLAAVFVVLSAPTQADEPKEPKPLPKDVTDAWKKAGAEVGWYDQTRYGATHFAVRNASNPGEIPAFRLKEWTAGTLPKLPQPDAPFMLDLVSVSSKVTDDTLGDIAGFKNLRALSLIGTSVTEKGIKQLSDLTDLRALDLALNFKTNDAVLKEVAAFKKLQKLTLGSTFVTDAGLKELAGLKDLLYLDVAVVLGVTDAGMKHLAGFEKLERLNLFATSVTDAGLKDLAALKSLKSLDLSRTKATAAGVAELQKALPNCKINNP